tara:strand:- start:865 stop:1062 length:198 start_codon:yes stop_codon:yes gene_type:complete
MDKYTFVLRVELADSADGNTEEEAREALKRSENVWTVHRANGQVLKMHPDIIPIHQLQGDEELEG